MVKNSYLLILMLLSSAVIAGAEDLLILCDDDGSYSLMSDLTGLIDEMSPTPTYVLQTNNGNTGTYSSDETYLDNYAAVYWYASGADNSGRETTTAELIACQNYINGGGHMFITGYDLIGSPDDANMAELINSDTYGDFYEYSEMAVTEPSHFIVNGDYGVFAGQFFVTETDHDMLSPGSGAVEVITIYDEDYSKCIYTQVGTGSVTGYIGNSYNYDFLFDGFEGFLQNWVNHVIYEVGIESASLGEIKAAFK